MAGWARINALHDVFADACMVSYERFVEVRRAIEELDRDGEGCLQLEREELIAGVQAVVASAMCFEAAIYDLAARCLGDRYVRENLERLSVVAKWVVIPRLVCGIEISKDRLPFKTFKRVVAERNRLVHWKSEEWRWGETAQLERLDKEGAQFRGSVDESFRAIILMSLEMDDLCGLEFNPLPCFDRERVLPWEFSPGVEALIDECRRIMPTR